MKTRLYDEYIRRLLEVNDESKTENEHELIVSNFRGWLQGIEDVSNYRFNGDCYYIDLFDSGKMPERPICCGMFLDWKHNGKTKMLRRSQRKRLSTAYNKPNPSFAKPNERVLARRCTK